MSEDIKKTTGEKTTAARTQSSAARMNALKSNTSRSRVSSAGAAKSTGRTKSEPAKSGKGPIALIVVAIVLAVACIILAICLLKDRNGGSDSDASQAQETTTNMEGSDNTETDQMPATELPKEVADFLSQYGAPDLTGKVAELKASTNPEIYAMVALPGCSIEQPVCQTETDEFFYSTHNEKGEENENGCIYTQVFNTQTFNDNLTVMYGRNTGDGQLFSNLHFFEDSEFFNANPYIYVYTESEILVYQIFAAHKFSDVHLIVGFNTDSPEGYAYYLNALTQITPGIGDNFNGNVPIDESSKLLVLSTGVTGDMESRYLVQGKLIDRVTI